MSKVPPEATIALLDAATIRATARILGKTPMEDRLSIDVDLSAFEQFISAILFCDQVRYLEDARTSALIVEIFGNRYPDFLAPSRITSDEIRRHGDHAVAIMKSDFLRLEWREDLSDLMRKFLRHMNTEIRVSWNYGSHVTGLFFELAGAGAYRRAVWGPDPLLEAVLFSRPVGENDEFPMQQAIEEVVLESEGHGEPIVATPDLEQACRSLNWLLFRTAYYSSIANSLGFYYVSHPTRSLYFSAIVGQRMDLPAPLYNCVHERIGKAALEVSRDIRDGIEAGVVAIEFPVFSAWLSSHGKRTDALISNLLTVRERREFQTLRKSFREYTAISEDHSGADRLKRLQHQLADIRATADEIRAEYAVRTRQGISTSPVVALSNFALTMAGAPVKIPDLGLRLPKAALRTALDIGKPHRHILRSLVNDLANFPRLGHIRDALTFNVIYAENKEPRTG